MHPLPPLRSPRYIFDNPFTSVPCDWGVNTTVTTNLTLPTGISLDDCVRTVTNGGYVCTIRDSDDELVSCTGYGSSL